MYLDIDFIKQKYRRPMSLDTARVWYYQDERPNPNTLNDCLVLAKYGQILKEIPLLCLTSGTPLYHWGSVESDRYLTSNSGIPNELVMNNLIRSGADFLQGGGLYVSTDILDSSEYGPALGVINLQRDLFFANYTELFDAIGRSVWNDLQVKIKLRDAGIVGTYSTTATPMPLTGSKRGLWLTITDHRATQGYRTAKPEDFFLERARPNSTLRNHLTRSISIMGRVYSF